MMKNYPLLFPGPHPLLIHYCVANAKKVQQITREFVSKLQPVCFTFCQDLQLEWIIGRPQVWSIFYKDFFSSSQLITMTYN